MIAWDHKNIAVRISERIKRRLHSQRVLERGIDIGVVCVDVPAILFVGQIGFNALTERIAGVLKELVPDQGTRDRQNVIGIEGVKPTYTPVQQSLGNFELASQAAFKGVCDHLLQRGITNKSVVDQAGPNRIGAGQFQWCWRSICYCKIAVEC